MYIRKATTDDIERQMEIFAYAREFMAKTGNPNQWGRTNWPPKELILQDISDGKSYVCEHEGRIVGTFFYDYGIQPEPTYAVIENGNWIGRNEYGVVHRIAGDGSIKGIGSFCINWAFEQCKHLRMDTHEDNKVMQNLLRKLGFIRCGLIHLDKDNDPRIAFEKMDAKLTNVYFVRHAQPNYDNHDDNLRELSAKGMEDRLLVTSYFSNIPVNAVLSSPFKRAVDTVKDFADKKGLEIETIDDFRERKVNSEWIEDFNFFSKRQWQDFQYKLSDGECLEEVMGRNVHALFDVLHDYEGQTVVVGSHGTALSTIIHNFCDEFAFEQFQEIKGLMPWCVHFVFEGVKCLRIENYDFFTGNTKIIM